MRRAKAGPVTTDLVGSERVRRHPHRRARSAPQCGVSRGPRAYRVRVPIGGRLERGLCGRAALRSGRNRFQIRDPLELGQNLLVVLGEMVQHACVAEQLAQVALGEHEIEVVGPV